VSKLLEIKLTGGCVLMLYDTELMDALPEDVLTMGLRRGKAIKRRRLQRERERKVVKSGLPRVQNQCFQNRNEKGENGSRKA
jgi:hypothetical protein